MDKAYVVITGAGVTSRANLEALVEDYFYAKGKETYLVLPFEKTPSQGQVFAAQYARDKGKDIVIFCNEGADISSFPKASVSYTNSPIAEALEPESMVMILWEPNDKLTNEAVDYCVAHSISAYNLCEGLSFIDRPLTTSEEDGTSDTVVEEPVKAPVSKKVKGLTEEDKAEIVASVLKAVEIALQNALKKA
jgi:hypothetical protein